MTNALIKCYYCIVVIKIYYNKYSRSIACILLDLFYKDCFILYYYCCNLDKYDKTRDKLWWNSFLGGNFVLQYLFLILFLSMCNVVNLI